MKIKSNFIPVELYNKFIGTNKLFKNKPISIFNDYIPTMNELQENPYNILVIQEPNELFGLHDWAIQHCEFFSCILTWSKSILDNCDNAYLLPFGTTFLHKNNLYQKLSLAEKKFEISFLCGVKRMLDGHIIRHNIFSRRNEIHNIPLKWFYTYNGSKEVCFDSSMFHLAIENSQNENYFTEKIVDAFISKTIPIYRGCPNISSFFDSRGFFTFNTEDEFFQIISSLKESDYTDRIEYIEKNYLKAVYYAEFFTRFEETLKTIIDINNI